MLDYQEGRTEIDEAAKTGDLVHRRDLLEQARTKLDSFVKAQPKHPLAREAMVQRARMLVERGHLAAPACRGRARTRPRRRAYKAEARTSFAQARGAFAHAVEQLDQSHKSFSGFIAKGDPRLEERTKVYSSLLDAKLQQAVTEYELAQTYPAALQRAGQPSATRPSSSLTSSTRTIAPRWRV